MDNHTLKYINNKQNNMYWSNLVEITETESI